MDVLATAVVDSDTSGVRAGTADLKAFGEAAKRTEGATEGVGKAIAGVNPHARNLSRAMDAAERSTKAMQQAGLNMGRQVTDVFVQLGSGASVWMVALQQGPQIFDGLQVAAMQTKTTVTGAMLAMGASVWAAMAPLLPLIGAVALAAGAIAGAFAIGARQINQANAGLLNDFGLTKEQLDSVGGSAITMGDVATGAFRATAKGLTDAFGPEIDAVTSWFGDMFTRVVDWTARAIRNIAGGFIGALLVIRDTWRMLPAAIADVVISAANLALRGVFSLVNGAIDLINGLANKANDVAEAMGLAYRIPTLSDAQVVQLSNQYAGAALQLGRTAGASFDEGFAIADRIGANIGRETVGARNDRVRRGIPEGGDAAASTARVAANAERAARAVEEIQEMAPALAITLEPLDQPFIKMATELDQVIWRLEEIVGLTQNAGSDLGRAFGQAGFAIGESTKMLAEYALERTRITQQLERGEIDRQDAIERAGKLEIRTIADVAGVAKSAFGERTVAYRALQAVEMAYSALRFANTIRGMALDKIDTGSSIANSLARGAASAAAGVAKIFESLGPFGFPVAAAALGVMASVGVRLGGGGGASAAPALPVTNSGGGTVLGDSTAESESISRSLEMAERYQSRDLDLSSKMVSSLRRIETDIGAVANSIARQLGVNGALSSEGLGLGTTTSRGFLGLTSTTRTSELVGRGLDLNGGTLADLINQGVSGSLYQLVQNSKTKSGFLGFGGGTTTWMTENRTAIDGQLGAELGRVLASLRTGVLTAASTLGIEGAAATLDALNIALGRIDFEGLSSSEISERLNAVFSAAGDQMAAAILPGLAQYQRAGEGMLETLSRLATTFTTVDTTLRSIGLTFGMVGLESLAARDRLVELSGGLEAFTDQASFFAENFLTDAQRIAPVQAAVNAELTRLGIASDISRTAFADLVLGLDVSTEAGAATYAALMNLAPALDRVLTYTDELAESAANAAREVAEAAAAEAERAAQLAAQIADRRRGLEIELMEAQGNAAGALAARRADELAVLDASLRPLQEAIWAQLALNDAQAEASRAASEAARVAEEAAEAAREREELLAQYRAQAETDALRLVEAARDALTAAYERESSALQTTIDKFRGFSNSLRDFRESLGLEGLSPGASFAVSKQDFERTSALARLGNEEALGELQGVSEAYLEQSRLYSRDSLSHLRNLGRVREAVEAAERTADNQVSIAQRQLDAMTAQVSGLITLNGSVLSLGQAITALASAQAVQAAATPSTPNDDREWGVNPEVNRLLARQTGYMGDFGSGGWQAWIEQQDESVKAIARATLAAQGQAYRIAFAEGGVFTSPTTFRMGNQLGQMAEAGAEAIMPLATMPGGGLGVRAMGANDNSALVAAIERLTEKVARLEAAALQTVVNTSAVARNTRDMRDDVDAVVNGGQSIRTVAA